MNKSTPESVGMSSDRLCNIQARFQQYVDQKKAPGFVTMVARKGHVVHYESCGFRDVEQRLPMEKNTIFRIHSMTKPITSVALMMLYEQGQFQLSEPVSKYIPAFGSVKVFDRMGHLGEVLVDQNPPMSIHHLMTHTSGLSYGWFQDTPVDQKYRDAGLRNPDVTLEEVITALAELPLKFQPGSAWHYSVATDVLGYLVQVLSDMPFETFLQERILEPLGMADTGFFVPEQKLRRLAALYEHNPADDSFKLHKGRDGAPPPDFTGAPKAPSGGGGLVSTTEDYLKFAQMLLNTGEIDGTHLLGRKTVEYMTVNHLKPELLPIGIGPFPISGTGFGLGFAVTINPAQSAVMNSAGSYGWSGAAATNFWVDPEEQIIGIIMTQLLENTLPFSEDFRVLTYQALID